MPRLSQWFIRTALLYLMASLALGVAHASPGAEGLLPWPTYVHLLVLGWLTQLIFGVSHWMFPRHRAVALRWSEWLGWATYGCLNAGLMLRVVAESGMLITWRSEWFVAAALLQLAAGWGFVLTTWPRVRGR